MKKYKTMKKIQPIKSFRTWEEGQRCVFKHLGATLYGVVNEPNERLTKEYGEPWYWIYETSAGYRVPVPSRDIVGTR